MASEQAEQLNSTRSTNSFLKNSTPIDISEWPFDDSDSFFTLREEKTNKNGGITCCVPHCYNNSKRNKELSFYVIPKDKALRKQWLVNISRKDFKATNLHRVCSSHFVGGKKAYMNNVPTIVLKMLLNYTS